MRKLNIGGNLFQSNAWYRGAWIIEQKEGGMIPSAYIFHVDETHFYARDGNDMVCWAR